MNCKHRRAIVLKDNGSFSLVLLLYGKSPNHDFTIAQSTTNRLSKDSGSYYHNIDTIQNQFCDLTSAPGRETLNLETERVYTLFNLKGYKVQLDLLDNARTQLLQQGTIYAIDNLFLPAWKNYVPSNTFDAFQIISSDMLNGHTNFPKVIILG